MTFSKTNLLDDQQKAQILNLWNSEYPAKLAYSDVDGFEQYLSRLSDKHHILLLEGDAIKGWMIDFMRNEERWFAMILDSAVQGRGWGSRLLNLAKEGNSELNGWVLDHDKESKRNGEPYKSPIGFYEKNGFEILWEIRLEGEVIDGVKIKWSEDPVE